MAQSLYTYGFEVSLFAVCFSFHEYSYQVNLSEYSLTMVASLYVTCSQNSHCPKVVFILSELILWDEEIHERLPMDLPPKKRANEGSSFRSCHSKGVSHHHLFGRDSKAGGGKLHGGKKRKARMCPVWRLLTWESWGQVKEVEVGHPVWLRRGMY